MLLYFFYIHTIKIYCMRKILLGLFVLCFVSGFSQFNYSSANAVNTTGTYTDLGTNGTAITTNFAGAAMTYDDDNSAIQNIGFNFVFNGTTFTQFVLNSNGFIKLGNTEVTSNDQYDLSLATATTTNVIAPFNFDLDAGTGTPEYRVHTTGTAGSRVTTIQFENVRDWNTGGAAAAQFANVQFQIKLYEGSNNIEFVYGAFTASAAPTAFITIAVGVRGSTAAASTWATKGSTGAWSTTTFLNGPYTGNYHNVRNTVLPDAGRTYKFNAALPNDAQALEVYALGKIPLAYMTPQTVRAVVKNLGLNPLTNVQVNLNITGATTFSNSKTIAALAAGASATVTFDPYTPTVAGSSTITVTVANDDNNANNTKTYSQEVTYKTLSHADNAPSSSSLGYNAGAGLILSKHNITGTGYVRNVGVYIPSTSNTAGNSVYGVVLDAAGTIIGQSAPIPITAAHYNTWVNFVITTPPAVTNQDFFVGLAQVANATPGGGYFPVGTQTESPGRTGAYYTAPLAGGSAPAEANTFGRFMIAAGLEATLPVTLLNFNGVRENQNNLLRWTTATETNSRGFELQRSADGVNFSSIGFIGTKAEGGNSTSTLNYNFTDARTLAGTNYYRLMQIDLDGKTAYSSIVTLKGDKTNLSISSAYPNPTKESVRVIVSSSVVEKANISVTDISGKVVKQLSNVLVAGENNININVSSLAAGTYYIRLVAGSEVRTTQFIKQ
jgi:trimeric autotransporter adhesin